MLKPKSTMGTQRNNNHLYLYADLLYFVNNSFGRKMTSFHNAVFLQSCSGLTYFAVCSCLFMLFSSWENSTTEFCSLTDLSPGARLSEYRRNMINDYWSVCYSTFQEHDLLKKLTSNLYHHRTLFVQFIHLCILHNTSCHYIILSL